MTVVAFARGVIRNPEWAAQLRDYSGLRFPGGITPTDIDGSLDFDGTAFVLLEAKWGATPLSVGQRRHFHSICRDHLQAGHAATALVLTHRASVDERINMASLLVREYWLRGEWVRATRGFTCRQCIDYFRTHTAQFMSVV